MTVTEGEVARFLLERIAIKEKRIEELNRYVLEQNQLQLEVAFLKKLVEREFSGSKPATATAEPLPENTGLSAGIRIVLRDTPDLRPVEVSGALESRGWKNTGKVPTAARVAAELARLFRQGQLQKSGSRYRLTGG